MYVRAGVLPNQSNGTRAIQFNIDWSECLERCGFERLPHVAAPRVVVVAAVLSTGARLLSNKSRT